MQMRVCARSRVQKRRFRLGYRELGSGFTKEAIVICNDERLVAPQLARKF